MKILGIDTSAKVTSVAIIDNERILSEFNIDTKLTHSQSLMPMVDSALSLAALSVNDIDGFAVSVGPGSFTGLRIGIGAVKGLSYTLERPCAAVSAITALAHNLKGVNGIICPVMDARCNQVYTAIFEADGVNVTRLTDDMAISIDDLSNILKEYEKNIFLVGDGADLCYNKFSSCFVNLFIADSGKKLQRAAAVALCSLKDFEDGNTLSAGELMPLYLRLPQAERERMSKMQKT